MDSPLDHISICTYSTGSSMVREVLEDWLRFLGGKPRRVICAVSPCENPPPIYGQLQAEGLIDDVLHVETRDRSVLQTEPHAMRAAVEAASTEWVLLIKLDTLPFRTGFGDWLAEDFQLIATRGLSGFTGGNPIGDLSRLNDTHSLTQKFSHNFSLFRRSEWLQIIDTYIGRDWSGPIARDPIYRGNNARFAFEAAVEYHLRQSGNHMLVRLESLQWSVFHVNVWGDRLRRVRERYLRREGVGRFLITGKVSGRPTLHPWDMYYMHPVPSRFKRLRIWLGRLRRELFTRR